MTLDGNPPFFGGTITIVPYMQFGRKFDKPRHVQYNKSVHFAARLRAKIIEGGITMKKFQKTKGFILGVLITVLAGNFGGSGQHHDEFHQYQVKRNSGRVRERDI